jgi:hypothetical protein
VGAKPAPEQEFREPAARGQPVKEGAAPKPLQAKQVRKAAVPPKQGEKISAQPDRPAEAVETESPLKPEKPGLKKKTRRGKPAVPAETPRGSVSDRLRELSGRSYDVYHDLFFAKARPAIRKVMGAGRGIFFTVPEKVEDLVFNFLEVHYSDPYMNWEESGERNALRDLGFDLESLGPIIDECFRML